MKKKRNYHCISCQSLSSAGITASSSAASAASASAATSAVAVGGSDTARGNASCRRQLAHQISDRQRVRGRLRPSYDCRATASKNKTTNSYLGRFLSESGAVIGPTGDCNADSSNGSSTTDPPHSRRRRACSVRSVSRGRPQDSKGRSVMCD